MVVLDPTRAAATVGFDGVWLNQRTSRDALTTLAIMGREVPDIGFGAAVVLTCLRRPLALAAQALTVWAAVGGHMALDVGVGHQAVVEGQYGYSMHAAVITPRGQPAQFAGADHRRVVGRAGVEADDSRPKEQGLSLAGPGGLMQQMNRTGSTRTDDSPGVPPN